MMSASDGEVVEQQREEADVEHLADQLRRDVVLADQRPEQAGQHDVEGDQDAGQEGDVAGQQAEPGVDVAAEHVGEAVDDVEVVHGAKGSRAPPTGSDVAVTTCDRLRRLWQLMASPARRVGAAGADEGLETAAALPPRR